MIFSVVLKCVFYLLDYIPFGIQLPLLPRQIENELRSHCLKRDGWVELNHHNTFPSLVMHWNHRHIQSRNPSCKNSFFDVLIWYRVSNGTGLPRKRTFSCDSVPLSLDKGKIKNSGTNSSILGRPRAKSLSDCHQKMSKRGKL